MFPADVVFDTEMREVLQCRLGGEYELPDVRFLLTLHPGLPADAIESKDRFMAGTQGSDSDFWESLDRQSPEGYRIPDSRFLELLSGAY